MIVLGMDTSTEMTSIALLDEDQVLAESSYKSRQSQMERLLPSIDAMFKETDTSINDIDGIAVGLGPGLFTASRIGVSTAKVLAYSLDSQIVGVCSLDVLAWSAASLSTNIISVIDARRGEVFVSTYEVKEDNVFRLTPIKVMSPEDLATELKDENRQFILAGDGAILYRDILTGELSDKIIIAGADHAYPWAVDLVRHTLDRFRQDEVDDPDQLTPIYVRGSDAEEKLVKR